MVFVAIVPMPSWFLVSLAMVRRQPARVWIDVGSVGLRSTGREYGLTTQRILGNVLGEGQREVPQ